ncbi:unnamed protein product [Symbiodinium natans]|uniref:Uncharacterized protein n=1 Tax=Symbiodinium natans TaxID=878477 RepID=A0A812NK94_9DINO|nr:unnamed protein product [Symbiodinium natans]
MPALCVTLISGKSVVELDDFEGPGCDLRVLVAYELRVSPERVKLLAGSREITNEESLNNEVGQVTAMVAEGQELPGWCQEKLLGFFSFVEAPGVGPLPEGSEEIDAQMMGHVLMLAMQRFGRRTRHRYVSSLLAMGVYVDDVRGFLTSMFKPDTFNEHWARSKLRNKQDLSKWRALHWKIKAEQDRLKEAINAFLALDVRLSIYGWGATRCYSRWETHDAGGKTSRHRVYGLRLNHNAVEFDKVLGLWLEPEGILDRQAATFIRATWSGYYARSRRLGREDGNDLRREVSVEEVVARFQTLLHLLAASQMGREDAAWLRPHVEKAMAAMMEGIRKETTLLAATAYNPTQKDQDEACMTILRNVAKAMLDASVHMQNLREQAFENLLWMAAHRNDAVRIGGMKLLNELFPTEERTTQLMEMPGTDWPHMHMHSKSQAASPSSDHSTPPISEIPSSLPSPRRLVEKSRGFLGNPVALRQEEDDVPIAGRHILFEHYRIGPDEW